MLVGEGLEQKVLELVEEVGGKERVIEGLRDVKWELEERVEAGGRE